MAAWRKKHAVVPKEDMCFSCFATTKYSCIKCGHSVCNRCSVFKDEEKTPGWKAGVSVGFCIACDKEEATSANSGQEEKAYDEDRGESLVW